MSSVCCAKTTHLGIAETLHVELVKAKETYWHMGINVSDLQLKNESLFQTCTVIQKPAYEGRTVLFVEGTYL